MDAFFLTDFLARQFEAFVIEPLGLDRHPELRDMYFGNYRRLVYLAQTEDAELDAKARSAAERLGLAYEKRVTGFGDLPALPFHRKQRSERRRQASLAKCDRRRPVKAYPKVQSRPGRSRNPLSRVSWRSDRRRSPAGISADSGGFLGRADRSSTGGTYRRR